MPVRRRVSTEVSGGAHDTADEREKLFVVERFYEKSERATVHGRLTNGRLVPCRDDDDSGVGGESAQLLLQLQAAHSRHPNIEHGERHGMAPGVSEKFFHGVERVRGEAIRIEQVRERTQDRWIVIDDADFICGDGDHKSGMVGNSHHGMTSKAPPAMGLWCRSLPDTFPT
jgi:hypothetical protein